MCMCVLGWKFTFDLCDCIFCSLEALQSTTCSASRASIVTITIEAEFLS